MVLEDERKDLTGVIESSERVRDTRRARGAAVTVNVQAPQEQTYIEENAPLKNDSEILKEERVRYETRNNDEVQKQLELLRIRDEKRRLDRLLGETDGTSGSDTIQAAPMREETVGELKQEMIPTAQPGVQRGAPTPADGESSATYNASLEVEDDSTKVLLSPRFGFSNFTGANLGDTIRPNFSMGAQISLIVSENMAADIGYTYNSFSLGAGAGMNTGYPMPNYGYGFQYGYPGVVPYLPGNMQNIYTMRQHMFDFGMRFYLLNEKMKLRPFVGGGGAYSRGTVNFDQAIMQSSQQFSNSPGGDYIMDSFLGTLSGGVDFKLSKQVTLGMMAKYYFPLSTNRRFSNPFQYTYSYMDPREMIGAALADSGMYSIMVGIGFNL
jgi:opacity protein-like surface antigen